jgi:hypothetical protein
MLGKTFRLFISSTFSDFHRERELLQTEIFPEIKAYCAEKGYTFQPIDLRWGVNQEAQLDQKTLELCLNEVRACKTHPHPNFLIMIGDRYGWIPLPYAIEKSEFEMLLGLMEPEEQAALLNWYKEDLNQLPVSYILKARWKEATEPEVWQEIENHLRAILQEAAKTAVEQSLLNSEQQRKYHLSATEAEVEEGVIPYIKPTPFQKTLIKQQPELNEIDPKHIFGFFRDINRDTRLSDQFIGEDYARAQDFKQRVKAELIDENIQTVNTTQLSEKGLDETYLKSFAERLTQFLKQQFDRDQQQTIDQSPLQRELEAQNYFAQQKRQHFIGREEPLNTISQYLADDNRQPLVIYGPSGQGKSALMAMAIALVEKATQQQICYRFIGATAESASSKEILISIFDQLGLDLRSEIDKQPDTTTLSANNDKQESFEDFSYRVHDAFSKLKVSVVIFIDAVDQLAHSDQFLWLPQTLPENIKIVLSALDDEKYPQDSSYFQTLKQKSDNHHPIPPFSNSEQLLSLLLSEDERTLQPHQQDYFFKQYQQAQSPLYVAVAVQEIKHWKSFDGVPDHPATSGGVIQDLEDSQRGIIEEFVDNLHSFYHHDKHFIRRVLGYLYASRDGLSENELLELVAMDEAFIENVAPGIFHENHTKELPLAIWTRLHAQLVPFLSKKEQDGEVLLYFFHREFTDVIAAIPQQQQEHEAAIKANQRLIEKHQNASFNANRWGRLYMALITELDLRYRDDTLQVDAVFIAMLDNEEWIEACLAELNNTGYQHNKYNRIDMAINHCEAVKYTSTLLYQVNPDRWIKLYTTTLNNLAMIVRRVNRVGEAIMLLEECLGNLKGRLDQANPGRWMRLYIISLKNLAALYDDVNQTRNAITLGEEGLGILKGLYQADPDRWVEDYTSFLLNLADSYERVDQFEEAITLEEESLSIRKGLYKINPDLWVEGYTTSLNNLALSYLAKNRVREAITLEEECLGILKGLYQADPDRWVECYTSSLNNLAVSYERVNQARDAIALKEESLSIRKGLYQINPDLWVKDYTYSLNCMALSYYAVNRVTEMIALFEESLSIRKGLYQANPDLWVKEYASSLNNLATSYKRVSRVGEAVMLDEESLGILKGLYQNDPDIWSEDYIVSISNLADSYERVNQVGDAIALEEESLRILKDLHQNDPDIWVGHYETALRNLAYSYTRVNRIGEAVPLFEGSMCILKDFYQANPDLRVKDYTKSLNDLAISYLRMNRLDDSLNLFRQQRKITVKHYGEKAEQIRVIDENIRKAFEISGKHYGEDIWQINEEDIELSGNSDNVVYPDISNWKK